MTDLAIIGGGPAGMSAAVYARRAGLSVLLFEGEACGGQMIYTPEIENYPGIARTSGAELAKAMQTQATALGAELVERAVTAVEPDGAGGSFVLHAGKNVYTARSLILATGAKRRKLGVPGEDALIGRGVSYCAVCDGMFFKDRTVAVVGGGNTALEDALYLAKICAQVYLIHRRDTFRAQKTYIDRVAAEPKIRCIMNASVTAITGDKRVSAVTVQSADGEETLDVSAVFIAVGLMPDNGIFRDLVALDEGGYILCGTDTATSCPGVFAAGDTRQTPLRQIVTAAADGAIAATMAERWLKENP